ncbi:phosphate ABC transporter substrate-binding protein PstS [Pseudactinotalea sp.]|uniref:phosphate ABC transporter substrate-binding protein PstS n=1 Tax=Pseudactinotalea sp. TaxID=1926260 RepID=UPI003B3A22B2
MKLARTRPVKTAALALLGAVALTLTACGPGSVNEDSTTGGGDDTSEDAGNGGGEELSGSIAGAGASSMENAQNGWLAGFGDLAPGVTVTYDPTGSGAGREQFLNGSVQFAGSDSALDEEELAAATERCFDGDALELPLYISPIAIVYNLPQVSAEHINLPAETIAGIFAGTVTNWNDPEIADANPDIELPDLAIIPVNRSDDSGTTENFTEYLTAVAPDVWTHGPVETWPISGTQSGAQTSGMKSTVESTEGTIGYIDASQAGELGTAAIGVGEEFVPFSPEAAAAIVDASPATEDATDLRLTVELERDTTEAGTYPIVLISYTIACSVYDNQADADNVAAYLSYIASTDGQDRAAEPDVAGSAPISDDLRTRVEAAIDQITVSE